MIAERRDRRGYLAGLEVGKAPTVRVVLLRGGFALLFVVIVGVGLWFLLWPGAHEQGGTAAPGVAAARPFGSEEARAMDDALRSGDPARVSAVLPLRPGEQVDPAFVAQLAAIPLDIDPATFTPQDPQTATVRATSGDRAWVLVLRTTATGWGLLSTVPVA